ncbi:hypothetical protein BU26DRAFT_438792 [Trematosphaeria pertusa]|uniref:C2H2-type domain-containing protein n=1 Tax=Trematosphaeria pertusa TaxID=390896 RepID=A0A6A6HXU6_9PLEO|nr:uncharacterized protein BU26DRAFT_438792 [Trematosphaeria pertusa]KAF2242423.1 hypothetical protein BU26DRAFT_438792 [Trematosphaeria pertusa]
MALPTILLCEFRTDAISDWVPGKLAQTYKQLESLTYSILSKDPQQWTVHFHLEDGVCEGKALPLLWNNGAYFDEGCLTTGKLHLFAHFERIGARSFTSSQPRTVSTAASTVVDTGTSSRPATHSSSLTMMDEVGFSLGGRPILQSMPLPLTIPQKRKRHLVQDLSSDSESEESRETHFLLSPSDNGAETESNEEGDAVAVQPQIPPVFKSPPLPLSATPTQHAIDFKACITVNAAHGSYGHKHNWDDIKKAYQYKVAHARLIKGIYGTPSIVTCDRCQKEGRECRIYHPDLKAARAAPGACGECRLHSNTCTMGGRGHRNSKKRLSSALPEAPPAKMPRLSSTIEKAKIMFYCPVVTCPRRSEGFNCRPNFVRHVEHAHPEVDSARLEEGSRVSVPNKERSVSEFASGSQRAGGGERTFICPVEECTSRAAGGYTRGDHFRRHIRSAHPDSGT